MPPPIATTLGPRFSRRWASSASTSKVSFSGASACWIEPKLRLWPHTTKAAPPSSTSGPVTPRGSTRVMFESTQLSDSSDQ